MIYCPTEHFTRWSAVWLSLSDRVIMNDAMQSPHVAKAHCKLEQQQIKPGLNYVPFHRNLRLEREYAVPCIKKQSFSRAHRCELIEAELASVPASRRNRR